MPVIDHPIHPSTQHGADYRYGCHNKPRPVAGALVTGSPAYGSQQWPFANSTECKHDLSVSDPNCTGCAHRDGGEDYDQMRERGQA